LPSKAQRFGFSGMEVKPLRYGLPVCIVIFNMNGIYRAPSHTSDQRPATTRFVKGARYAR